MCVVTKFKDVTPNVGILHGGETPKNQPRPLLLAILGDAGGDGCGMSDLNFNDHIITRSIKITYTGM